MFLLISGYVYGTEIIDYSSWLRIMTDSGIGQTAWTMTGNFNQWQKKTLNIDFDPTEIEQAAVEYELTVQPYDHILKAHITDRAHPWGNWQVKINGKLVFDEPANAYINKGTNRILIPADSLKKGDNMIEIGWRKLTDEEIKSNKRYGNVYFAVDLTNSEKARREIPVEKRPKVNPDLIRIRLLLNLK